MFKFEELEDVLRDLMTEGWRVSHGAVIGPEPNRRA
jgi:hypothetical protein